MTNKTASQIAGDLAEVVRGNVYADILHRAAYSTDASIYRIVPLCVVAPRDAADVVSVVEYARNEGIPVVARGAGTGLAGESLGSGRVFDMTRYMNKIVGVAEDGGIVTCEPGVALGELNRHLAGHGRKIGPDPSSASRATVGGCVANNATGAHSLVYGHIGDYVEAVEAVLADGSLVELKNDYEPGRSPNGMLDSAARQCASLLCGKQDVIAKAMPKTKRNRSGYNIAGICHDGRIDLARLMAGSEGTLAILTRITLRTVALPKANGLLQLEFDSLAKMADAVPIIVKTGVSACELMDRTLIDLARESLPQYRDLFPAEAAAVLLVEHTGDTAEQVTEKIEGTDSVVGDLAAGRTVFLDPEAQRRLWKSRKDSGPLLYRQRSRKHPTEFMEDVSVDHNQLGRYIAGLQKIGAKYDITMSFFGHAGDGELHVRPRLDLGDPADVKKMQAIAEEVFSLAWSLGGSISGEHADGLVRAAFVRRQYGDQFYSILCKIKDIFDPDGLMNPGKIINMDPDVMVKNLRRQQKIQPDKVRTDLLFEKDELALELEHCYGCGLCLSRESDLRMCPVFRATGAELGSSRAKANLLGFWASGQLEDKDFESPEFRKFLDLCVNCKACELQCPARVDVSALMGVARAEYVKRKGLRRAEFALSHNRYLSVLGSLFSPISNLFMRLGVFKWVLEKSAGIDRRRGMPTFKRRSFLKNARKYLAAREQIAKPIDKVAYFVDTYANYNDHELGFAVLDVLRHNDIEVILPKQMPAPLPAIVYGNVKRARRDLSYSVGHLAEAVREGYKIICSEPSAALCLKEELRHYVSGEDARLVSENTHELMDYLLGLHSQGKLKPPTRRIEEDFVYHLPCHLCAVGKEGATIELLQKLCGANVVDLAAGCCGLAGTFGMQKKNYELSSAISESLKNALESAPTRNVLTECAACKMQIEHLADGIVRHPIKVLAEGYSHT
ncbi:MAG: anaerobic glycerol-3-phosphate dehydrogenase subunit C [Phycisphaerales bacterium]|nr:MAG: anaerobic glycerol-3-phosphate dehydrogenase subunit C [Phycisphaerales bacterium]